MYIDTGIDVKELECFAYVVETSSFSRAAEHLNLSQPTVSAHISTLERKVGLRLIERNKSGNYPSDAGKILYEHAISILRLRKNAGEAIRAFSRADADILSNTAPEEMKIEKDSPHFMK